MKSGENIFVMLAFVFVAMCLQAWAVKTLFKWFIAPWLRVPAIGFMPAFWACVFLGGILNWSQTRVPRIEDSVGLMSGCIVTVVLAWVVKTYPWLWRE
jgi:hypothetical protein